MKSITVAGPSEMYNTHFTQCPQGPATCQLASPRFKGVVGYGALGAKTGTVPGTLIHGPVCEHLELFLWLETNPSSPSESELSLEPLSAGPLIGYLAVNDGI